jgi:TonB family protein
MKLSKNSTAGIKRERKRITKLVLVSVTFGLLLTSQFRASATENKTTATEALQEQSSKEQSSPADYLNEMGRKIKKSWSPSDDEARQQTMVGFTISQDGTISNLKILRSSSNEAYDKRALEAVMAASPFERLPESTEKIEVQFSFDNRRSSHAPPTRDEIGLTESDLIWLPSLAR